MTRWHFPCLPAHSSPLRASLPIGFARCLGREYTFSIFAVVTIALIVLLVRGGAALPLYSECGCSNPREQNKDRKPSRIMSAFRVLLLTAMRHRWMTIAITLACFVASLLGLQLVPRQFFPASDRPELVVDLTLPAKCVDLRHRAVRRAKLDAILEDNPDVTSWSTYVGRGAIRFYLPLNVQLNNDFLRRPWLSRRMLPRANGCRRRLRKSWLRSSRALSPGLTVGAWTAGGMAGAISRQWADLTEVRTIGLQLRPGYSAPTQSAAGKFRLDGAGAQGAS